MLTGAEVLHDTRVFLTGFMGSGKSTLGPLLANVLGLGFADLDAVIEEQTGARVGSIFSRFGESRFRELEAAALVSTRPGFVYALGGGSLNSEENLAWTLSNGVVIYLKVSAEELLRRLRSDSVIRPLLLDGDGRHLSDRRLQERIGHLLRERVPTYRRAHITLAAAAANPQLAEAAAEAVCAYKGCSLKDLR